MIAIATTRSQPKKKWLSLGIRLSITLLLFAFLLKSLSWQKVWQVLLHMQLAIALVALGVGFLTRLVSVYQWKILLKAEQIFIGMKRLIKLYLVGMAFNQFLPTSIGGDVVKAYYVGRDSGNTVGSISAVLMTRILGFFGMLLVALPALLLWRMTQHNQATQPVVFWLLIGCALVLLTFGSALCLTQIFSRFSRQSSPARNGSSPLWEKILQNRILAKVVEVGRALTKSASHPRSTGAAILLGALFHLGSSLNYYVYGLALHLNAPLPFYFMAIPLVALISVLPISVNGFGVREVGLTSIFATAGVPIAKSLLMVLAMDLQLIVFAACGSCIYFFIRSQGNKLPA